MDSITILVAAKVNLSLFITGAGALHTLDSVMCSVNLYDKVKLTRANKTSVIMNDSEDLGHNNTVWRAIEAYTKHHSEVNVNIEIIKGIPIGAGLGGSSADTSAVLYGLSKLYGGDVDSFAVEAGSDVPFMLKGGMARVRSIGENIEVLPYRKIYFVVAKPVGSVSTKEAYSLWDRSGRVPSGNSDKLIEAMARGQSTKEYVHNDLFETAATLNSRIAPLIKSIKEAGAEYALMSGSGSAVFGCFGAEEDALNAASMIDSILYEEIFVLNSIPSGIKGVLD